MLLQASTVELCSGVDSQWFVKLPFCPSALDRVINELGSYFYLLCVCLVIQAISRYGICGLFVLFCFFLNGTRLIYVSRSDDCLLYTKIKEEDYRCLPHLSVKPPTQTNSLSITL